MQRALQIMHLAWNDLPAITPAVYMSHQHHTRQKLWFCVSQTEGQLWTSKWKSVLHLSFLSAAVPSAFKALIQTLYAVCGKWYVVVVFYWPMINSLNAQTQQHMLVRLLYGAVFRRCLWALENTSINRFCKLLKLFQSIFLYCEWIKWQFSGELT